MSGNQFERIGPSDLPNMPYLAFKSLKVVYIRGLYGGAAAQFPHNSCIIQSFIIVSLIR